MSCCPKLCKYAVVIIQAIIFFFYFTDEEPNYYDVLNMLARIDAKWHEIGLGLEIPPNCLDGLQQSHQSNAVKLASVLTKWMELNGEATPVTWETIRDVVKGPYVQNNDLAVKIYQSLKEESTRQQIVTREYKI